MLDVTEIIQRNVISIQKDTKIFRAIELMSSNDNKLSYYFR